ncbi:MAG: hypothetical protein FWH14_07570 [Oscillospiraceae bacterium]|nr:hypothetical protein [Oscillospiraceae bacterium]
MEIIVYKPLFPSGEGCRRSGGVVCPWCRRSGEHSPKNYTTNFIKNQIIIAL